MRGDAVRRFQRPFTLISSFMILWSVVTCASGEDTRKETPEKVLLFNTLEFKGSLKALTKWARILSEAEEQIERLNACASDAEKDCPPGGASWVALLRECGRVTGYEQLKVLNAFVNKWPYRLDKDVHGMSDYWATPQEFLSLSGDCEDYCITKYFALRELGYDPGLMRIVVIRDQIRNISHATLAVYLDGRVYILDNISNAVFDQKRYTHYTPQYSFNENNRWAHIPVKKPPEKLGEREVSQ